jgi:hypothetical protein
VDFLHSPNLVISQARLPIYMYYSKIDFNYKLDRTTVTVGAPSRLAILTSPASTGASSSTWAITSSTTSVVAEGSGLLSAVDARGSLALLACCADSGTTSSTVGDRLRLLSVGPPTVSQLSSSPLIHGVGRWNVLRQLQLSACNASRQVLDYSTRETHLVGGCLRHL